MTSSERKRIKKLLYDVAILENELLDKIPQVDTPHSPEYIANINALIEESKKKERSKRYKRNFVAILVASIMAFAITACVVKPVRELIIEVFSNFTRFSAEDEGEVISEYYAPSIIPEGYDQTDIFESQRMFEIRYSMESKNITFMQGRLSSSDVYDSEEEPYNVISLGDKTVYLFECNFQYQAVWRNENYRFTLSYPNDMDIETVKEIIGSVGIIEDDIAE